jgi:iron complex outermembrane receptor protein
MASYTLSHLKLLDYHSTVLDASGTLVDVDFSGKLLPGVPRHRLTGMLRAHLMRRLDLGVQVEWQSVVYVESGNEMAGTMYAGAPGATPVAVPFRAVPARTLTSMDASWAAGPITLLAGVENLSGVRYTGSVIVNDLAGRFYEPGPGRTLFAGVRIGVSPQHRTGGR